MTYLVNIDRFQLLNFLPKNGLVAEVGVKRGKYAHKIFKINKPSKLHLIDPWGIDPDDSYIVEAQENPSEMQSYYERVTNEFSDQIKKGKVEIHRDYSHEAAKGFPDFYFDWIYVDANHLYEHALNDLISLSPKVKENGFIVGHDFVNSSKSNRQRYGVTEAVKSFLDLNPNFSLTLITNENHCSFVISKQPKGENEKDFLNKIFSSVDFILKAEDLFKLNYKQISCEYFDSNTNEKLNKIIVQLS